MLFYFMTTPDPTWQSSLARKSPNLEVLPQPAYSPDLAPSNYHLFRALKLREKKFDNQTQLENEISSLFSSQLPQFRTSGSLMRHWTYVLDHDGDYVVD
ncbi:hypothetical protein Y032_0002g784 [Ancylostoma ceylanicum]|uniref:Tc1-like transposase DDE domain-containing protein n=1 Tax=Ancylostoma ceylanicum TaxID=53326 RepID=A0A016W1E3_9BILA|nr:hypothetical protein Y032_0002g784 [Ancylostoma ceylanicum]